MIGPEVPVTIPKHVQPVEKHLPDYEVELTVVIGKPAKNVSEADALDYVLAYTAGNDVCPLTITFVDALLNGSVCRSPSDTIKWPCRNGTSPRDTVLRKSNFTYNILITYF